MKKEWSILLDITSIARILCTRAQTVRRWHASPANGSHFSSLDIPKLAKRRLEWFREYESRFKKLPAEVKAEGLWLRALAGKYQDWSNLHVHAYQRGLEVYLSRMMLSLAADLPLRNKLRKRILVVVLASESDRSLPGFLR